MLQKAAIIGFGCAGYHAAKAMRDAGWTGEIHVYTDTTASPANPMLTTYYVSGKLPYEGMFPFGPLEEIAEHLSLTLHPHPVESVDSASRTVTCADGTCLAFDKLLFATGARAFVPPLPGAEDTDVYCMRTVSDAVALKGRLDRGGVRSAVVIGASMVGIKLVELLQKRGITCTLADMAPRIFPLAALPDTAEEIHRRLTEKGVTLKFSAGISSIERAGGGLRAHFGDGSCVPCDLILLCIGTRANTGLADSGVRVNRGIVVDERMETSVPGIYAAGDCCEGNNLQSGQTMIIGLWATAARQGTVAGRNMAGCPDHSDGNIPHNITHFMDMDFIGAGDNRVQGETVHYASPDGGTEIWAVLSGGRIACLNILDNYKSCGALKQYLLKRLRLSQPEPIPPVSRVRLLREGIPAEFLALLENGYAGSPANAEREE